MNAVKPIPGLLLLVCLFLFDAPHANAQPPQFSHIRMEVGMVQGVPVGAAHSWSGALGRAGLTRVRVAQLRAGTKIEVRQIGEGPKASYTVFCVLNQRNVLVTSGGKFSLRDMGRLKDWLSTIGKKKIAKPAPNKPLLFGLTQKQLQRAHLLLSPAYTTATKGASAKDIISLISRKLGGTMTIDPTVKKLILADDKVRDELKGLSYGTTLAAVLRPMGLAISPRPTQGDEFELRITRSRAAKAIWPIGFPPVKPAAKYVPDLVKVITVKAEDTLSLTEALAVVTPRLKVPVLLDHNSLLRKRIDPNKVPITFKSGRFTYSTILRKILATGKLKYELRLDENNQPFFWITTRG